MKRIALVGNPNCGKTTLFNRLTGERAHVGNWPGVTVERREGVLKGESAYLVDLPGLYSLSIFSPEEEVSRAFLKSRQADCILNLVDARAIRRSLFLTHQLLTLGIPLVVALGMLEEGKRDGIQIDLKALARELGVAVVDAADTRGLILALGRAKTLCYTGRQSAPPGKEETSEARYRRIDRLLESVIRGRPLGHRATGWNKRKGDGLFLHRGLAIPLFLLVMGALFWISFGPPGLALGDLAQKGLMRAGRLLEELCIHGGVSPFLKLLLRDGVLGGVGTVLCFLPQLGLLFLGLAALEEWGYLARAAFIVDAPLRGLGLSGKAFVPLLAGFGCTTTAVPTTRTLYVERERRITLLLQPFCSCGARFPVYALFAGAFFPRHQGLMVAGCYLLGIFGGLCRGWFLKETLPGEAAPFLLELPRYRVPRIGTIFCSAWEKCGEFLRKAGTVLFLLSISLWLLQHVAVSPWGYTTGEGSLLYMLGEKAAVLFAPLGFGFQESAVALLSGAVGKEAIVSTLGVLCGAGEGTLTEALKGLYTPLSAGSFLTFVALCPPCMSALAAMKRELGAGVMLQGAAVQLTMAYGGAMAVYQIGLFLKNVNIL